MIFSGAHRDDQESGTAAVDVVTSLVRQLSRCRRRQISLDEVLAGSVELLSG